MYTEVDVFVSNYTLIDPEIYQLWIDGCSSSEAVNTLHQRGFAKQHGATLELIASDVLDHYRTFALLERLFTVPSKLSEQMTFQIDEATKQMLIEKYYDLDDAVIRELLGRKLSSRHRKDLDEVAERSGAPLRCCRRQFDNVRRVFKTVEEMPGNVVANIRSTFLLSEPLAKKYGAVVFIACMRFETSKRKLQYLTFNDYYHCAQAIMSSWTYSCTGPEYYDTEMDREFLLELRELRILLDKEKEHKHLICMRLRPKLLEKSYQELELNFRLYTRALVGLACNLHRGRELRSLFIDLLERCVEPLRLGSWPKTDLAQFLCAYEQCALQMDVLREADLKSVWERYMRVISQCLLTMCVEPLRLGSWPKTDLAQFLCAYEQCALQMDVLREADLKSVWERYMRVISQCLLTMCVEPLRLGSWPKTDLAQFLCAYEQCALQMDVLREADLKSVWERYMRVISQCLLTMYHI